MKAWVVITYTTKYRLGGPKFARVARTLSKEKEQEGEAVHCKAIESKHDLIGIFDAFKKEGKQIKEFHFVGHSGMYGPMYGTVKYPEQFSPFEIKHLDIPFNKDAAAYFHCCRSARWFAPYFARTQQVTAYGYHWYTTFSATKDHYTRDKGGSSRDLFCFGCPGRKSHGYVASFRKYFGHAKAETWKRFSPEQGAIDTTYNAVAQLYHNVFSDIKVREDEYAWIDARILKGSDIRVLDIGCGNGALLRALAKDIGQGVGVDLSEQLIAVANSYNRDIATLSFQKINGPALPFAEDSFDVVVSMMSFRYLDWDPIFNEIQRILVPKGQLLIVDMVTAPVKWRELPQLLIGKLKHYAARRRNPRFYNNLKTLVSDPDWSNMLRYNPIRSEHEMQWYLESRFPGHKVKVLNVGYHSRIIAFETKAVNKMQHLQLSYP